MEYSEYESPGSLLETTLNTRDLGCYQSGITGNQLRLWRILRSDVQHDPSDHDLELLIKNNILTVIDMRSEPEILQKPSGFAGRKDFEYLNIPIAEGCGIPESVDAVSTSYILIAKSGNMVRIFRKIAAAYSGVMINCTAGKDRTGVVSAVLLGLCGVSEADIIRDYMLTKVCCKERFELIHRNFPGIDMNIVIPHERYMKEFICCLNAEYGSFGGYLTAIGITEKEKETIRAKLLQRLDRN